MRRSVATPHAAWPAGSHATLPRGGTCAAPPGGACAARTNTILLVLGTLMDLLVVLTIYFMATHTGA
jgi:hypothetical protein